MISKYCPITRQLVGGHQTKPYKFSTQSEQRGDNWKICISLRQDEANFMVNWGCQSCVICPFPCTWVLMVLGRQVLKAILRSCSCATLGSADECMHTQQLRACWNCRMSDASVDQGIGNYLHINIWGALICGTSAGRTEPCHWTDTLHKHLILD